MQQPEPTRQAGLERLATFLPNAGRNYASDRNSDYGPSQRGNISLLSGHIRHRLLLETEVLETVLSRFSPASAEKFIQEVYWRGYFKGWLEQHPSVWAAYREQTAHWIAQLDEDADLSRRFRQAIQGETGIACFDAWATELIETGYLHNHSRMWFASIWIFTLNLPWQLGADFFYRHLIDGDPAANTLSWRWVGGLHTKGKIYLARPSNIEKYTNGRFAPHGQLVPSALPLGEAATHTKQSIRTADTMLPSEGVILLITEEDGRPEELFSDTRPLAGLSLLATTSRSTMPVGDAARNFARCAVADATERASACFGLSFDGPCESDDWGSRLARVARDKGATSIVTAFAPIGPVAERLTEAQATLEPLGIALYQRRRDYDERTWPHAGRGFFALKKKIPDMLEQLQRSLAPRLL